MCRGISILGFRVSALTLGQSRQGIWFEICWVRLQARGNESQHGFGVYLNTENLPCYTLLRTYRRTP